MDKINESLINNEESIMFYYRKMNQLKLTPLYIDFLSKITYREIQYILKI